MSEFQRADGRASAALRPVSLSRRYTVHAEGSVLVAFGHTKVLCTASVEEKVPPHKRGSGEGWVTAEYGMLPRATHTRGDREAARGKQSGRTQEIQRLIGRSLRSVFDLKALGERSIHLDCDVLQADGGTRTAAITGAYVAAHDAVSWLIGQGRIAASPIRDAVAAVSVGIVRRRAAARPGLHRGLRLRHRHERRHDRQRRFRRGAGHGRRRAVLARRDGRAAGAGRTGIGDLVAAQKAALVGMSAAWPRLVLASNNAKKLAELRDAVRAAGAGTGGRSPAWA